MTTVNCFQRVKWNGTQPTIPGCLSHPKVRDPIFPYIRNRVAPRQWVQQLAEDQFLLDWVKQGQRVRATLPMETPSYDLHVRPLEHRLDGVSRLFASHVPPTEIFGKPAQSPFMESVHAFYYHVAGLFLALGFDDAQARATYVKAFQERTLPPESRTIGVGGIHFFPGGWSQAGEVTYEGQVLSLALFTPRAFQALFEPTRYVEVDAKDLYQQSSLTQRTRKGTTYFFDATGSVVGYDRAGRGYRRKEWHPAGADCSHAGILRRQVDPFNLGIIRPTMEEQMRTAGDVIRVALQNLRVREGMVTLPSPLPAWDQLAAEAVGRVELLQEKFAARETPTAIEQLIGGIQYGLAPWLQQAPDSAPQRYVRFLWLNVPEMQPNFFAVDGNLLHYQLARLVLGTNVVENARHDGETSQLLQHLRGGVMKLHYNDARELASMAIVNPRINFPLPYRSQRTDALAISMTDAESGALLESLEAQRKKATFFAGLSA